MTPLNTAIIPYGVLKDYKARMDFVSGYLIALGISPVVAPENLKPLIFNNGYENNK